MAGGHGAASRTSSRDARAPARPSRAPGVRGLRDRRARLPRAGVLRLRAPGSGPRGPRPGGGDPGGHPRAERRALPSSAGGSARLTDARLRRDRPGDRGCARPPVARRGDQRLRALRPASAGRRCGAGRRWGVAGVDVAQARRTAVVDGAAPRAHRRRGALRRVLDRPPRQHGDRRHRAAQRARAGRRPGEAVRRGDAPDTRRPRARRLVRAVTEPRRDHHVPARLVHPAGAHARGARLRRPAGRPARLRRERGRPQRLRLGVDPGHRRRGGVAAPPAGRAAAAHRRSRPLGGRRADARGRRRQLRSQARW